MSFVVVFSDAVGVTSRKEKRALKFHVLIDFDELIDGSRSSADHEARKNSCNPRKNGRANFSKEAKVAF